MGPSHTLFPPPRQDMPQAQRMPRIYFPLLSISHHHTRLAQHKRLPDFAALAHSTPPPSSDYPVRDVMSSCLVIFPSAIHCSCCCQKHFACDREPLRSNASSGSCLKECPRVRHIILENKSLRNNEFNMCDLGGRQKWGGGCPFQLVSI